MGKWKCCNCGKVLDYDLRIIVGVFYGVNTDDKSQIHQAEECICKDCMANPEIKEKQYKRVLQWLTRILCSRI